MPEKQLHPSDDQLNAFSLGQLPPADAAEVESHISACVPCCETLLHLSTDDTFVALLQDAEKPDNGLTLDQADSVAASEQQPPAAVDCALAEHPRYRIVELIAKGGMGDVFKAEHRMMERTVALKVIRHELVRKPEAVERFHREVKTAASLSHPNIVTSHDAEQAGDVHFLVMEYVDGVDLAKMVKQGGPLPVAEACDYIGQAATGLQYAHERGMVHRDIKPHNLMVTADHTVKILDFGLASLAESLPSAGEEMPQESSLTATGTIMGTPDFISPEQSQDAHGADIRSDIYSLGVTLYYLLSGRAPFAEGSVMNKLKSHAENEPEPIECVQTDVPPELAKVIRQMMAKDPADRFQTPADVANSLAPFVDRYRNESPPTKPSLKVERSRRPPRKSVALLLGAMGLLLAGIIYFVTDHGTLEIESNDPDVEIAIRPLTHESHEGNRHSFSWQYRIGDTVTGSTVKWLRSGAYIVDLKGRENEFIVSQDRFILRRGGRVIVKITRRDATAAASERRPVVPVRNLEHEKLNSSLVYFPDGTIVTSAPDLTNKTWNLHFTTDSSGEIGTPVSAGDSGISHLATTADGKWLVAGIRLKNKVQLWDAERRKLVHTFDAGGWVHGVSISPDGKLLAAASWDGSAKVWNRESRELVRELGDFGRVHRVQFSPDGTLLAISASPSGKTELYDTATWEKRSEFKNDYAVGQMAFSSDGQLIATGGCGVLSKEAWKTWVRVWDVASGEMLMEFKEPQNAVSAVAFSPDARYLIAVGGDQGNQPNLPEPIRIWDLDAERLVAEFDGHDRWVRDVAFAPDGKHFATVSNGVKVWNLEECIAQSNLKEAATERNSDGDAALNEVRQFDGHTDIIHDVLFLNHGTQAVSASEDGTIRVWDVQSGRELRSFSDDSALPPRNLAVSPDGMLLASTHRRSGVHLWDMTTGELTVSETAMGGQVVFTSNDELVVLSGDKLMYFVNPANGNVTRQTSLEEASFIHISLSPDRKQIAATHEYGAISVIDLAVGTQRYLRTRGAHRSIGIAWSSDGKRLAVKPPQEERPMIMDAETGETLVTFEGGNDVIDVAFTSDGRHVITGSNSGRLSLWDARSGKEVAGTDAGSHCTSNLNVSPTGTSVISGGGSFWDKNTRTRTRDGDFSLHVWQIRRTRSVADAKLFEQIEKLSPRFPLADRATAEELLKKALVLEPNNPEWSKQLGQLYRIAMKGAVSDARRDFAEKSAVQFRQAVKLQKDSYGVYYLLADLAEVSLESGSFDDARAYANQLLAMANDRSDNWFTGNAIHHGNLVLGRLALHAGDTELAKAHLLAAGQIQGSPQLKSFGPDMTLAQQLLERGESKVVVEYLKHCKTFWHSPKPDQWIALINGGLVPDFGANGKR